MKRRRFISLLGGAVAVPLSVRAQQTAVPEIAVLGSGAVDAGSSILQINLMADGMRELGLTQGRDYVFETRWADCDSSRFPRPRARTAFAPAKNSRGEHHPRSESRAGSVEKRAHRDVGPQ